MKEGESLEDLLSRFNQICFRFCNNDKTSGQELYDWFLYLLCLSNEKDQLRNDEPIIDYLNDLPLEMCISEDTSPSIDFDTRCDFIESIIVAKTMLRLCVAHVVLDKEQEDASQGGNISLMKSSHQHFSWTIFIFLLSTLLHVKIIMLYRLKEMCWGRDQCLLMK